LIARHLALGDQRVGRKIGLTAQAVQDQLGVRQPDFGTLLASMAIDQHTVVPIRRLLQPKIEAEIAFVLAHDIDDPAPSLTSVAAAVGVALPAFEIVDSRIKDWDITIVDTVADNASSGLFVLGSTEVPLSQFEPAGVSMQLTENGVEVSSGVGSACLGDPLLALQWLARTAAALGDPLQAGEIVLSGALGPMVPVRAGATYEASFDGLGSVRVAFSVEDDNERRERGLGPKWSSSVQAPSAPPS